VNEWPLLNAEPPLHIQASAPHDSLLLAGYRPMHLTQVDPFLPVKPRAFAGGSSSDPIAWTQ
jgi:hypothetical protein